jgi:hypothetical protein
MLKDLIFAALAVALFGAAIYRAVVLRDVSGVTSFVFGAVVCSLIVSIDRFEFITLSPNKLEARARAIIQQAEVTQREFLKLAAVTGELLIDLNAAQGRFVGSEEGAARDKRKAELLETLNTLGFTQQELAKIAASDRKWTVIDYVNGITNLVSKKIPKERMSEWQTAVAPVRTSADTMLNTTPQILQELLDKFGVLDDETRGLIEDYIHFLDKGEQRRPDVWARRYSW